ncbi:MAG: hypothetical protein CMB56_006610 [Methanobacteriota archaeon]|nr:MAG: hypothetical protein CMB56_006610 [Euryarchaeota archaeon]|tara:strand:+ start:10708 stop:11820 length:1113 start_codon:yes stop_codon:yes gene_type:complete
MDKKIIIGLQIFILLISVTTIQYFFNDVNDSNVSPIIPEYSISVQDSNEVWHNFSEEPKRIAIANTYAATVMRMLGVDPSVVVGVSGDFYDEELWPEYVDKKQIQRSAHSEIDFEALIDTRPEVYIVFATNGMVDTKAIRMKLEPIGIKVIALDFYKYDSLRDEINVTAKLFGKEIERDALFDEFERIENDISKRISLLNYSERPRIVMEHHASLTRDPVVLTGTSQWTDIIERAGGINVFKDLPGHTTHVDMEKIISQNPDYMMFDGITFDIGFNSYDNEGISCDEHLDFIRGRVGFEHMNAVKNNSMMIMSGEFAGPMMIHGLPTLAKMLHPELFDDLDAEAYLIDYFSKYHNIDKKGKFVCKTMVVD